jgi:hypothetical protein
MSLVLIHGFGRNIHWPGVCDQVPQEESFPVFKPELQDSENPTRMFYWAKYWPIRDVWEFMTYRNTLWLYWAEKKLVQSPELLQDLHNFLVEHRPRKMVCHSMGCFLLRQYFERYEPPSSLRTVMWVQADVNRFEELPERLEKWLAQEGSRLVNMYCPWDQALWGSLVINQYGPAGLFGHSSRRIENKFMPLKKLWNLHQRILEDERLKEWVAAME